MNLPLSGRMLFMYHFLTSRCVSSVCVVQPSFTLECMLIRLSSQCKTKRLSLPSSGLHLIDWHAEKQVRHYNFCVHAMSAACHLQVLWILSSCWRVFRNWSSFSLILPETNLHLSVKGNKEFCLPEMLLCIHLSWNNIVQFGCTAVRLSPCNLHCWNIDSA